MTFYKLGHVVGEKGEKGDPGEKGAKGDTGPQGPKGDPGEVNIVTSWESTLSDSKVASEKLVKNTIDTKQATLVSGTNIKTINNNSLLGSGNINIGGGGGGVDIVTSWESTLSDEKVPSEKLTKNTIDNLNIPTKISDLTNDSDFIETSSTSGLLKNDGTVMTSGTGSTNYSAGNHTHSGYVSATKVTSWSSTVSDSNVPSEKLVKDSLDNKQATLVSGTNIKTINNSPILGSGDIQLPDINHTHDDTDVTLSNIDIMSDWSMTTQDSFNLKVFNSINDINTALSSTLTTSDIANNLTTTTSGKVLDARQGKALADLIGDAISYINL